jgi:hypothetical protein
MNATIGQTAKGLPCGFVQAETNAPLSRGVWWGLVVVLMAALLLRVACLPARYDCRSCDEPTYIACSLELLEGLTPAMKAAPAGPQTWIGWVYAGTVAVKHAVLPEPEIRAQPLAVRPFLALDKTLFDAYRDLSGMRLVELWVFVGVAVWSAGAIYRLGLARGGVVPGLFAGLLVAGLPMFVEYTCMARPYSLGWSFALLALASAGRFSGRKRTWATAVFLGLAIGSRIEMLGLVPLVLWLFWERPETGRIWRPAAVVLALAAAVTLLVAPWILENLIGNLRTIMTVRFAVKPDAGFAAGKMLREFCWDQGLGLALVVFLAGIVPILRGRRLAWLTLWLWTLALLGVMLHDDGYGMRHQGPTVFAFLLVSVLGAAVWYRRSPRLATAVLAAVLVLPLVQAVRLVAAIQADTLDDAPVTWVEQHVRPGARVYIDTVFTIRSLVPTQAAADALWNEVTNDAAWRAKFRSGLTRFKLGETELPRALSEENMIQERGGRRGFFIQGGQSAYAGPRFDLRFSGLSPVFGVKDQVAAYRQTGGVVLSSTKLDDLGEPRIVWASRSGRVAIYLYYTDDVLIGAAPEPAATR